jgi:RNA polymerase sigma factor (sigma-70 family)
MYGKQLGAAVRQFQRLIDAGTAIGLTDDQLLARFVSHRDDVAFEMLVERHGPMVLSVCRGMLKDPNDAQDGFQATFLVLVRKAGSIRAGVSLGSWLYRVAYNMALQINAEAARRQRIERRAGEMANPIDTNAPKASELIPALYEEVNKLPEKYRMPVVLCHLEEMTHAQAARQLGWSEGAVRGRVARAREVLRRRLARRGLVLSAGAVASVLAERSASAMGAALPAAWVDGTVKAAMAIAAGQAVAAGAVAASAVTFSDTMVRSLFMTKLKVGAAALLAAGGAAFVVALAAGTDGGAMHKDPPPTRDRAAAKPVITEADVKKPGDASRPASFTGRVVDPENRPVIGARLYVTESYDIDGVSPPAIARARSAADGGFSFRVPLDQAKRSRRSAEATLPTVVAIADGFGPGFGLAPDETGSYTIRLARDDIAVEGRILDTEGRPVAGGRVQVVSISWVPEKDLSRWREALRSGEPAYPLYHSLLKTWSSGPGGELFAATKTGPDGRFTLRGIGRERIAGILIEGPSIRTTIENVVTGRDTTVRVQDFGPGSLSFPVTYYGARFDHVAEPSRPITGVVRDIDTGKPLAGVIVRNTRFLGNPARYIRTTTDAEGRYRLEGLMLLTGQIPRDDEVLAKAPEGQPYLSNIQSIIEPIETKTINRNFALKRGIWIKGRVIDKATRQPHAASVDYFLFKDNPHASEAARLRGRYGTGQYWAAADGTFRVIGIPGRALLCARAGDDDYRMGVGAERIKEKKMTISLETISLIPDTIFVNNFHVLKEINPPEGVDEVTFELALDRGEVVKGRVLDPEGRPLAGAQPRGLADWWDTWTGPLPTAEFEVTGLASGDARQLAFLHRERRLSGSLILRGEFQGPIEVKLEPWGTVTGRLVDEAGQPRAGVELGWPSNQKRRVEEGPGSLPEHAKTDADGRFRLEGLAPGLRYELQILGNGGFYGAVFKELTVKAGETRDLGDVKKLDE